MKVTKEQNLNKSTEESKSLNSEAAGMINFMKGNYKVVDSLDDLSDSIESCDPGIIPRPANPEVSDTEVIMSKSERIA